MLRHPGFVGRYNRVGINNLPKLTTLVSAGTLNSLFTLTRGGSGTYCASDGTLTTASANEARRGYIYNGSTWEVGGLVHEPSLTNVHQGSETYGTVTVSGAVTKTATTGSGPKSNSDSVLDIVVNSTATGNKNTRSAVSVNSGDWVNFSVFLKYVNWRYVQIAFQNSTYGTGFGGTPYLNIDLQTNTVTYVSNDIKLEGIEIYKNGYIRVKCYAQANTTNIAAGIFVLFADSATAGYVPSIACNVGDTFRAFGFQIVSGTRAAGSYIPTASGSTATRLADVIAPISSSSFALNHSEGGLFAEVLPYGTSTGTVNGILAIAKADNSLKLSFEVPSYTSELWWKLKVSGVENIQTNGQITSNTNYKLAMRYKSGDNKVAVNSALKSSTFDTSTFTGTFDDIYIGKLPNSTTPFCGLIKNLGLFTVAPLDYQLKSFST